MQTLSHYCKRAERQMVKGPFLLFAVCVNADMNTSNDCEETVGIYMPCTPKNI